MDRQVGRMDTLPNFRLGARGRRVGPERANQLELVEQEQRPEEEKEEDLAECRHHLIQVMSHGVFVVDGDSRPLSRFRLAQTLLELAPMSLRLGHEPMDPDLLPGFCFVDGLCGRFAEVVSCADRVDVLEEEEIAECRCSGFVPRRQPRREQV